MSPNHILILPHSSILQHLFFFTTSFIHSNKNKKILSTSNKQLQLPVPTSFSPNAISLTQQQKILTGNWSSNPINNPNFPINVTDTTNPIYLNSNKKIKHRFNLSKKTTTNNRNIRNIRNIRNTSKNMSTTNTNTTGPETSTSTASKPSSTSVSNSVQKKIAPGAVATNSTTSSTSNSDFTVAQHKNTSTPKKIRQKPPSSSSSSSSPASTTSSNGTSNTFSSSTSNLSSITLPKDDDSSVMHISCTVASEEASTIETRHSRSRGTLVCVECGMRFSNIKSLQKHIQNKTVWTNRSLLGCRVSVMWCVSKSKK